MIMALSVTLSAAKGPKRRSGFFASPRMTLLVAGLLAACKKEALPATYQAVPVDRRDPIVALRYE